MNAIVSQQFTRYQPSQSWSSEVVSCFYRQPREHETNSLFETKELG